MRLGAPVARPYDTPDDWARAVREAGCSAAYCPVDETADADTVAAYARAAAAYDIVIAEVGAWGHNPVSPDPALAAAGIAACAARLALADRIGARCCVNVSGSRGPRWDGPHPENLLPETVERVVQSVREIIDRARPQRTFYCLEMMPWMVPDSADCYLHLLEAVDRPAFAVHVDPVNLLCSPRAYLANGALIRGLFAKLGGWVRSCHAKDALLRDELTFHVDEVQPGIGALDYDTYLVAISQLEADTPLMVEHLPSREAYAQALAFIRRRCDELGIACR